MGSLWSCFKRLFQMNESISMNTISNFIKLFNLFISLSVELTVFENPKLRPFISKESLNSPIEANNQLLDNDFLEIEMENEISFDEIKEINSIEENKSLKSYNTCDSLFPQEDESKWFLPHCSRENAERLLKGRKDGTFLVRDSLKLEGKYILSIVIGGHIRHCVINKNDEGYSLYGSQRHPTLMSLIMFYAQPFDQQSNSTNSCTNLHFPIFQ